MQVRVCVSSKQKCTTEFSKNCNLTIFTELFNSQIVENIKQNIILHHNLSTIPLTVFREVSTVRYGTVQSVRVKSYVLMSINNSIILFITFGVV